MRKVICIILLGVLCATFVSCGNTVEEYNQKLYEFQILSLSGGAKAESVGNMIKSIWYNTIYEVMDVKTILYTHPNGEVNDDFNTSLALYFSSDEYLKAKKYIEDNLKDVDKAYLELAKYPEDCEEGYKIITTLYERYEKLINSALNPSGSLQTYSEAFNTVDTEYMNAYRKLERYFEAVDFEPKIITE
jgi:hypothetical protein